jgi:transcriptional regulator with PAS, ATPase and Fis domain
LKKQKEGLNIEFNRPNRIILGSSPVMLHLMQTVGKIAATDANVLITGENGTGKEVIAREIHHLSDRSRELLVSVDMGAIPESLFESELFGHKKGAFTDASEDKIGKFELANGGTLFLDEIGNFPLNMQSKLLVALQNRGVIPLGGREEIPIDFRLISATNSPIDNMVETGQFREDLLYRINTIQIEIPPLRQRIEDIEVIALHFLNKYSQKYNKIGLSFTKGVFPKLKEYHWPGNIRELEHLIERTVILSSGKFIHPEELLFSPVPKKVQDLPESFEEMERLMIANSLTKYRGNYSAAAAKLGVTRQTLYNKSKKYGI